ncbi:hypothetical protein PYW07_007398 [Mythimna separata]|uniref:Uncharacterized protein n=1 Tax=Mythimna separata TaxID=271217 RepID=A0AAD8E139_MYTSE|nr:hypothetical protein PYW07_007398 [Mythimna separata]
MRTCKRKSAQGLISKEFLQTAANTVINDGRKIKTVARELGIFHLTGGQAERLPKGHGHGLPQNGEPLCWSATMGSGGNSPCTHARFERGDAARGRNSAATTNRDLADRVSWASHGGMVTTTVATQCWVRHHYGGKSSMWSGWNGNTAFSPST